MARATLRFYAELNDFLPAWRRQRDSAVAFDAPVPVRHLVECCGVPHTEIELVLRNGESVTLDAPVDDGDRLAVYPVFEAFDVQPALRLRAHPLRQPRFLADAHLGRLARYLRMLGFDTLWHNDLGDGRLVELACAEHRILLSSDRRLLMRRAVTHGCFVRPGRPWEQLTRLVERLQLCGLVRPFSRCTRCNAPVTAVPAGTVAASVPPGVRRTATAYWRCEGCARVYWRGSHWQAMRARIVVLCPGAGGDATKD